MTADAAMMLFLQYALGGILLLAIICAIASFFFMLRSVMSFGSGIGNPAGRSSDSERGARMFDGPKYAAERTRLGFSALVLVCSLAILAAFILIKNHLTCCQLSAIS